MSTKPLLVISLDFELYWGMFDKVTLATYGENLKGVHEAIPELLALFERSGIHATWAVVGMLAFERKDELLQALPDEALQPHYDDMRISSYYHIAHDAIGTDASSDPYHYGPNLIRLIAQTPHQEVGSHTFSHYYCLDGGKNGTAVFAADCHAFAAALARFGIKATSIVFPRNQTTPEALEVCRASGFTAYRGTPEHFLYTGKKEAAQVNPLLRILRLIDAYVNISGHHTFTLKQQSGLYDVSGSWFLRPYSRTLQFLEKLRIRRIKNSMTYAAQHNEIFHLWWHPHNFGINRKENLNNLIEILEHFAVLQKTYGMQSATMSEAITHAHE